MSEGTIEEKQRPARKYNRIIKISLLMLSVGFMIIGVLRGEAAVVLQKAVLICLECIGVG